MANAVFLARTYDVLKLAIMDAQFYMHRFFKQPGVDTQM